MAEMTDERESRRTTFDAAADRYDRARPEYPDDLFDELRLPPALTCGSSRVDDGIRTRDPHLGKVAQARTVSWLVHGNPCSGATSVSLRIVPCHSSCGTVAARLRHSAKGWKGEGIAMGTATAP
jgi:hypothetical protein